MRRTAALAAAASIAAIVTAVAGHRKGSTDVFEVRSRAIEGNLVGDSPVRNAGSPIVSSRK